MAGAAVCTHRLGPVSQVVGLLTVCNVYTNYSRSTNAADSLSAIIFALIVSIFLYECVDINALCVPLVVGCSQAPQSGTWQPNYFNAKLLTFRMHGEVFDFSIDGPI